MKENNKDNPFTTVNNLFTSKEITPIKNGYLVNKILSYQPETLLVSARLNKFSTTLPEWATTALFNICVPKQRSGIYLQYIKKIKEKDVILLKKISQVLCCNEFHARQAIEVLRRIGEKPSSMFGLKEGE